jgi:phage-related tail protein
MIITKEQQERIVEKYVKEKHNTDECIGFIDGINATIELFNRIKKQENEPIKTK